jgi:hypothetical protein
MAKNIDLWKDPMFLRGIERIIICLGAIAYALLGYFLFINGLNKNLGAVTFDNIFLKIIFIGTGPGLFFMAFGAIVLITALLTRTTTKTVGYGKKRSRIYRKARAR